MGATTGLNGRVDDWWFHFFLVERGGGYRVCVGTQFLRVATTTYCEQVFGLIQFLAMTCSCHTDSCTPLVPLSSRPHLLGEGPETPSGRIFTSLLLWLYYFLLSSTIAALPSGGQMSFSQRLDEIRTGFERPFWVANITEIFERVSYCGVQAVLAIYLHEVLKFSDAQAGDLIGYFGLVVWFLPILGGSLADRFGFRRSLAFAYLVLAFGYF